MGISVVICCYNSSIRLSETLRHLAAQIDPGCDWEIVLVDNASTDNTSAIALQLWEGIGNVKPLRIVQEVKRGIHHARFTGIREAKYDTVIFCDDDNWLSANYLEVAYSIMSDGSIGVCGGNGEAVFEEEEPVWFQQYKAAFACSPQAEKEGFLGIDHIGLYSAGMCIRRDAIIKILDAGYQSEFEARNDGKLSGGEDFELVVLIRLIGYKAFYSDRLHFQHFMPQSRMTWSYLKRLVKGTTINLAPVLLYTDTFRLLLTGNEKYRSSYLRDIGRAIKNALTVKVSHLRDLQIVWIKLTGGVMSVLKNIPAYSEYSKKVKRLYELHHKGAG